MIKANKEYSEKYDVIGMSLSILCGVHCILTPFLLIYFPALGENFESPWLHFILILAVVFSFYHSVFLHYKVHKSKSILSIGVLGFSILFITYLNEVLSHGHEHHDGHLMTVLSVIGSVLLITSHVMNIKKCKCIKGEGLCINN